MQLTINIKEEIYKKLQQLKSVEQKTIDEEIEEAIEEKMLKKTETMNDPFFKWFLDDKNVFKKGSGETDISENHDKYLYEDTHSQ